MLRTDLTTAVARLATDRLRDRPLPLRLAYEGPIYRTESSRHRREGEFVQLGAELLGLGSAAADAEAVVLLCDALAATGLRGFRLAIGSVAFHRELVAALGLSPDDSDDSSTPWPTATTRCSNDRLTARDRRRGAQDTAARPRPVARQGSARRRPQAGLE